MGRRYPIRDNRSKEKVKPRVFDVVIEDDGEMKIEVKGAKGKRAVALSDFKEQISEFLNTV